MHKHIVPFHTSVRVIHLCFDLPFTAGQIHAKRNSRELFPFHVVLKPSSMTAVRSVVYLVLQGAVLPLGLFANDDQVQVVVASAVARQAVHMNHISKQVQFTPGEWIGRDGLFKKEKKKPHTKYTNIFWFYLSLISYEASSPLNSMGVWILPG